jgi:hypothetical protein
VLAAGNPWEVRRMSKGHCKAVQLSAAGGSTYFVGLPLGQLSTKRVQAERTLCDLSSSVHFSSYVMINIILLSKEHE